jgi:hypothetical protein
MRGLSSHATPDLDGRTDRRPRVTLSDGFPSALSNSPQQGLRWREPPDRRVASGPKRVRRSGSWWLGHPGPWRRARAVVDAPRRPCGCSRERCRPTGRVAWASVSSRSPGPGAPHHVMWPVDSICHVIGDRLFAFRERANPWVSGLGCHRQPRQTTTTAAASSTSVRLPQSRFLPARTSSPRRAAPCHEGQLVSPTWTLYLPDSVSDGKLLSCGRCSWRDARPARGHRHGRNAPSGCWPRVRRLHLADQPEQVVEARAATGLVVHRAGHGSVVPAVRRRTH